MHHSSYKANGLYSRLCKPAAAFTLRLLLSFALIAGLNDSYAQSYMGPSFSITYPLSDYNSIDYSTYQTATNCGYNATDWSDGNVIKVGEGTVVVTTVSPVTYISFDFGALDEVNGETITFSGINGGVFRCCRRRMQAAKAVSISALIRLLLMGQVPTANSPLPLLFLLRK